MPSPIRSTAKTVVVLQSLWRAALGREEGIRIPCATASEAHRLRFAFYNAVRGLRISGADGGKDRAFADQALLNAVDNCSLFIVDTNVVWVLDNRFSKLSNTLAAAVERYGVSVASLGERAVEESVERVQQALAPAPASAPASAESESALLSPDALARYYGKP